MAGGYFLGWLFLSLLIIFSNKLTIRLFYSKILKVSKESNNKNDFGPIDPACRCMVCKKYSRAYLHHLFKAREMSAYSLATIHNLHYIIELFAQYRADILNDKL